jgi:hypothetical protein
MPTNTYPQTNDNAAQDSDHDWGYYDALSTTDTPKEDDAPKAKVIPMSKRI